MEANGQAPRRASFTNASDGAVSPFTSKPVQPLKELSPDQRKEFVRDRTHVEQE
jgi:filamentous hemagglutinin